MRVCGCEPHPAQFETLRKAKFPGSLVQVAIGEQEGMATLHVPTHDLKCCSLLAVPYANTACEIQVWTLDRFDRQMGCPDRILLWLDVEGSELSALRSAPRLLASGRIRWINLEERRNGHRPAPGWCDPRELHAFLADHGYVRITDYNRQRPAQTRPLLAAGPGGAAEQSGPRSRSFVRRFHATLFPDYLNLAADASGEQGGIDGSGPNRVPGLDAGARLPHRLEQER